MTEQERPIHSSSTLEQKMYTRQEIILGIQEELGLDYIHFNIPDKLYTEDEYQSFKLYAERLIDFSDIEPSDRQ